MAKVQRRSGPSGRREGERIFATVLIVCMVGLSSCESDEEQGEAFCESVDDEVDELLRAAQSCEQDDDCSIAGVTAPCLILCSTAVNSATDLAALRAEATRLSDDFRAQCEGRDGFGCAVADCVDPSTLHAECSDGRCTVARSSESP